jgi:hypothetical protein
VDAFNFSANPCIISPCAAAGAQLPFEASAVQPNMAMPHQTSSSTIETDRLEGLSRELQRWLTGVRASLADEIRSYPTPIPRCDAQFNHLVEQRGRLSRLLTDLEAALDCRDGDAALRAALAQLPDLPPQGDSIEERSLRDRIGAELTRSR